MNKELNAAEAVYGFVGWLTSREERTVMSAKDDCAPIAELIKRFCTENNLPEVSDQWPLNLIHPSGEVAVPNAVLAKWGAPAPAQAAALVSPSDDDFMAAVNEMDGLYAAPLATTSAPKRIWLDLGFNPHEDDVHFSRLHDLTWSQNNATGDGIEYVRADLAAHNSLSL